MWEGKMLIAEMEVVMEMGICIVILTNFINQIAFLSMLPLV